MTAPLVPPYLRIAREVLEAAKANDDDFIVKICRRYLINRRLGRDPQGRKADLSVILQFADDL